MFYTTITSVNWNDLDVTEQKSILFFLIRAQQDIVIRPGGLYDVNHSIITKVNDHIYLWQLTLFSNSFLFPDPSNAGISVRFVAEYLT